MYNLDSKSELSLPSNPAKIDQRIAESERRIPELTAKVAPTQEAVKKAEADAKVLEAALAKVKAEAGANEARARMRCQARSRPPNRRLPRPRLSVKKLARTRMPWLPDTKLIMTPCRRCRMWRSNWQP